MLSRRDDLCRSGEDEDWSRSEGRSEGQLVKGLSETDLPVTCPEVCVGSLLADWCVEASLMSGPVRLDGRSTLESLPGSLRADCCFAAN